MTNKKGLIAYKSGDVIMKQGETGDAAYLIEKGRVDISITTKTGDSYNVGTRGPGTIIGEMALVDKAPRTATVKAVDDCELLRITQNDFNARLNLADPVIKMISQVIMTRYRDTLTRAEISRDSDNWPPVEAVELNYARATDAVERIKLANDFQIAIENNQLSLHYQPIVDLKTQETKGFEALMRWTHPEQGEIYPDIFIPIAEESGLIVQASHWALREACQALKRIEEDTGHNNNLFMSVNFSSTDFAEDGFVDTIYNTISETDIRPDKLHLEITERLLMKQPDSAGEKLKQCQKAGINISIDDFGTGYSSLSYLHYFPIDTLKIDRSFVSEMHKDENSMALIKSIITLCKNMKMDIIAEGVETKEEADELTALGCEYAQGYYFSRPMPERDVIEGLKNKN